jgi:8-oxo-dGTP diphosphatase
MIQQRICIGVIENQLQQLLVGKRKQGTHLQDCWEFPGGKVASHESFKMALRRELHEELGIRAHTMSKLIELQHQYEDRHLRFHIFKVTGFSGQIRSAEAQELQWVPQTELASLNFPAANSGMIDALILPSEYMIADQDVLKDQLLTVVRKQLHAGVSLIQYRACSENKKTYIENAKQLKYLCVEFGARLICNCDLAWVEEVGAHGNHLNSRRLYDVCRQPSEYKQLEFFSASCHSEKEVAMANEIGVRCILLGPVNQTESHADCKAIGWNRFSQLCFMANSPAYALGGLNLTDVKNARVHGAQGIAAIRAFID